MRRTEDKKLVRLRVKDERPTLEEAMFAAAGMIDDLEQQVEIAAALLGLPLEQDTIRALKAARPRPASNVQRIDVGRSNGRPSRAVVVERKRTPRAPVSSPPPTQIAVLRPKRA